MGLLRLDVGSSPLRTEHQRLLEKALKRGEPAPEIPAQARLEGGSSPHAIAIGRERWRAGAL
ncbi:MAG: hypothetical protein ACK5U8_23550, partial [Deltaproteobacteria bacterium]